MSDIFTYAVGEVFREEGGFVNDMNDPGGATNHGVTIETLSLWRNTSCTVADVENLTEEEATRIYKALYWDKVHGDDLQPAKAILMFDAAVNQGVGMSIKFAQRALNITDDGVIGPQTLTALKRADSLTFAIDFLAARALYYAALPSWGVYNKGWLRRLFSLAIDTSSFIHNN